jgi:hypothetical protein
MEKSEQAYNAWSEKIKNRPKASLNSYIIANGKCLRYHDWSSNPEPTFVNPIPWMPIEVPKPDDSSVKNKRSKSTQQLTSRQEKIQFY